jgi:hypothetical protein
LTIFVADFDLLYFFLSCIPRILGMKSASLLWQLKHLHESKLRENACCSWRGCSSTYDLMVFAVALMFQAEMKEVCCSTSGIRLPSRYNGRYRRQWSQTEYHYHFGAVTAVVLQLCAHLQGPDRVVVGDSAFSSLKTLCTCFNVLGMFFIGIFKTASCNTHEFHSVHGLKTPIDVGVTG